MAHHRGDQIAVLDFGSQYTQLIARRIRELKVYCQILPCHTPLATIADLRPRGLVLSGGPSSVYADDAPLCESGVLSLGIPVLGICYGMQWMAHQAGGRVEASSDREYGFARLHVDEEGDLFAGITDGAQEGITVWMSHGDRVAKLPAGYRAIAHTSNSPIAAMKHSGLPLYGLQFHPEVAHTPKGKEILRNFVFRICGCRPTWQIASFIGAAVAEIRGAVGDSRVICALSGGVDSTVTGVLVKRAIGNQLTCIFVDNGLLRKGEAEEVVATLGERFELDLRVVDASERFLTKLRGVVDPEEKRRIIGREFIAVFEEEARKIGRVSYLAQGTLYPDVIESISLRGPSATIKSHHNVGALPERMGLKLIEPLRELFKDEVRLVGEALGLPEELVWRHPFPGPGLAVRIVGEVTPERLAVVREADAVLNAELRAANLYREAWQSFAVLLPVKTVGVMGDRRTFENVVALRVVTSVDAMTADWMDLPAELLGRISNRIINEVKGVNRVVYDISSKPPSTIEWE